MSNIPELLNMISGVEVKSKEMWEKFRRPEIMNLFSEYIYGVRPTEKPKDLAFKETIVNENFNNKNIIFKKIDICFCGYSFEVYGFFPENGNKNLSSIIHIMHEDHYEVFDLNDTDNCDFIDFNRIFDEGYAYFIMPTIGIALDWEHKANYEKGVFSVFTPDVNDRNDNSWATISAWAWGASRVMDYIEAEDSLNSEKVAVIGHSRGGKTALWAGATDKRFLCVYSHNSGCTGAAMHRTKNGEHIKDINITDWFCKNYHKYNDCEEMLPVDQHMLIAALAPRYVYVSSSSEDRWADPLAERLSCRMASPAYELYDKKGAILPEEPLEIGKGYHDGNIGYHVKQGKHSLTLEDWNLFIDFLKKKGI